MVIEFPEAGGKTGSVDLFERMVEYFDRQTSKAVLGQTATTDAIKGGYAVGRTHDEVRGDIEQSDARQLAATLNRDVVRPYIDLNKGPQKAYPRILIGRSEQTDVTQMSDALAKLVPLGFKVEQSVVRDRLGFPDPEDDAELLVPPAQASPFPALTKALARAKAPIRDAVDALAEQADAAAAPAMDKLVGEILHLVETAADLRQVADGLLALYPTLDASELGEAMRQALVAADLSGRSEIVDG
jgi:phage gp29-like protein